MSPPAARPGLRERVAAAVVKSAAAVLAERGEAASMNDVASAAGVARGTLYRYFPGRDVLLEAVGSAAVEQAGQGLAAARLDEVAIEEAIDILAADQHAPGLESQVDELFSLYRALEPPTGSLRMTETDLQRHRTTHALTEPKNATAWKPRGWLAAALTALDGHQLGLIQAFDKQTGDFTELDEAILTQLAQMAAATVERAQLYRRTQG